MSSDLAIYKQNRTKELQKSYNTSLSRLKTALNNNIRNIKKLRQLSSFKQTTLDNLVKKYNIALNNLNDDFAKK